MNGILNVFKPKGMTSHDIVAQVRKITKVKKVGHTGTLDPNASGVLLVCIGKGTRISEYMLKLHKEYIGELTLGCSTDTQDSEGRILKYSNKRVNESDIYKAFDSFRGEIEQVPPMYSALKYKGQKLYELARKGKVVERKPRKAIIYDLKIMKIMDNKIIFYVKCSKGTYIRTLCNDIGELLGTYGYMSYLIRTGIGNFKIENSISLDYLKIANNEDLKTIISPIDEGLKHLRSINVEEKFFNKLINGAKVSVKNLDLNEYNNDLLRVYCGIDFIGVGRLIILEKDINIKMEKVLI